MNKNFKKIVNVVSIILISLVTIWSILKLIKLIRKYDAFALLQGFARLSSSEDEIVDVSGIGVKFIGRNTAETAESFADYLALEGYKKIGKFGKSDLYEYDGEEIIVKRSKLFSKYYLFEIFNDDYVSRMARLG